MLIRLFVAGIRGWLSSSAFIRVLFAVCLALCSALILARPANASGPQPYTLAAGETLETTARLFGVRVEALIALNALPDASVVRPGQRLLIPERRFGVTHSVQAGQTLGAVAKLYGMDPQELAQINQIPDPDRLEVGQALTVTLSSAAIGDAALPAGPIECALLTPWPATQGQTVELVVRTSRPISLTATFAGRDIPLVADGARQWALLGIHPLAPAGFYPVTLRGALAAGATMTDTGEVRLQLYVAAGEFSVYDIVLTPESGKAALLDPQLIQAEQARLNAIFAVHTPAQRWSGMFRQPLPAEAQIVSSMFGERRSYNGGPVSSYHEGIDFAAPGGTPVTAPAAGIVALAEPLNVRGNAVIIDHGFGVFSGYWHLSEIGVKAGQRVRLGDVIGAVGTTGLSTGNHLHWELHVDGVPVDPQQWARRPFP